MKTPDSFRRFNQTVLLGLLSSVLLPVGLAAGAQPGSLDLSFDPGSTGAADSHRLYRVRAQ